MGRPIKKRRFPKRSSNGAFQSRQPAAVPPSGDAPEPLEDSSFPRMDVDDDAPPDDHDEDWRDEDAGAASGGGQATLSFRSVAAGVSGAAVRSVQSLCPEFAPHPRAAQPPLSRSTIHRRKKASVEASRPRMAMFMAGWLGNGALRLREATAYKGRDSP